MAGFWSWNLINLFNFYLAVALLVSTMMRVSQYRAVLGLVRAVPSRWPRVFDLVKKHATIFMTWTTVLPAVMALGLLLVNLLASRLVWRNANLTMSQVVHHWQAISVLLVLGSAMLSVDLYGTFWVGKIDRELMQKYFDQAEYWLRPWTAPVVRIFTLGYINPRTMVAVEVRKALIEASKLINTTLWWVSLQVGLRMSFGLALWLTYALWSV